MWNFRLADAERTVLEQRAKLDEERRAERSRQIEQRRLGEQRGAKRAEALESRGSLESSELGEQLAWTTRKPTGQRRPGEQMRLAK